MQESKLKWVGGAWFGALLGGNLWMLVTAGYLLFFGDYVAALIPAACFAGIGVLLLILWNRRRRIEYVPAMFVAMAVMSVLVPIAWFGTEYLASSRALDAMSFPRRQWWLLGLVPGLMVLFALQNRNVSHKTSTLPK